VLRWRGLLGDPLDALARDGASAWRQAGTPTHPRCSTTPRGWWRSAMQSSPSPLRCSFSRSGHRLTTGTCYTALLRSGRPISPTPLRRKRPGRGWAHLGSNQGPPACEAGALPLSYAPGSRAEDTQPHFAATAGFAGGGRNGDGSKRRTSTSHHGSRSEPDLSRVKPRRLEGMLSAAASRP
jgi:hypothetical protein